MNRAALASNVKEILSAACSEVPTGPYDDLGRTHPGWSSDDCENLFEEKNFLGHDVQLLVAFESVAHVAMARAGVRDGVPASVVTALPAAAVVFAFHAPACCVVVAAVVGIADLALPVLAELLLVVDFASAHLENLASFSEIATHVQGPVLANDVSERLPSSHPSAVDLLFAALVA